jgi:ribonucleoside-diphosphate reductase alpha chain
MNFIAKQSYKASIELAKEKGAFPFLDREKFVQSGFIKKHVMRDPEWSYIAKNIVKYGIRNGRIISVAPTGTLSLTFGNNCSSGLEPIFSLQYDRKVKMGGQDESNIKIVKMEDYSYKLWKETTKDNIVTEDKFVTAMNLTVDDHLKILKTVAFHVDMSCSKTINIPTEYPFEDTKKVYEYCWANGIKGCTIFRPNPLRQGILISPETKKEEIKEELQELKRGEWQDVADDTEYFRRKIYIGCGKLNLFIGYSYKEKSIQDLYVVRSGHGGCERNLQGMVIAMSGMLRLGGNIFNIEKAFDGVGVCPSFISQRVKGEKVSSGSSCGIAILTEIKKFLKEIEKEQPKTQETPQIIISEETSSKLTNEEKEFIKTNGEIAFANKYHKCPICGTTMINAEGCVFCGECGWSKCS